MRADYAILILKKNQKHLLIYFGMFLISQVQEFMTRMGDLLMIFTKVNLRIIY